MRELIIGYGEIGQAVKEAVCPKASTWDLNQRNHRTGPVDVMHICFPYTNTFVKDVKAYITKFEPKWVIVWSTVAIGTCRKIDIKAIHSPVEGKHPKLAESIKKMRRVVGTNTLASMSFATKYFKDFPDTLFVTNTKYTEFLKLMSTSTYGINLVWYDYLKKVADQLGMDFSLVKEFNAIYNALYMELGMPQYQRYILDPPNGHIGGHCIIPNAELLNEQFPSGLLSMIEDMK